MDKQQFREEYSQAFYRSLEEGKIEITALPAAQQQALCRALADATFAALHASDGAEGAAPAAPTADGEEHLIWSGKSQLSLGLRYELTSQRLRIFRGMFGRSLEEIDLITVHEAKMTQNISERMVNIGDVILIISGPANKGEVRLENVKDPMEVRELIRKAYMAEQARRGLKFREQT